MLKAIGKVAWEETKCFFLNSRLIIVVFELILFCQTLLVQVKELCQTSGMKISFFEPYLLICTGDMYFLAIPLVFIILLSAFPSKRSYNYFSLIRISRLEWLLGELLFLFLSAVGYTLFLGVPLTAYVGRYIRLDNQWSSYMLTFHRDFPDLYELNTNCFLNTEMMTHGSPMSVFMHSVLLMLLMLLVVALIQMTFALLKKRYFGMLLSVGLTLASAFSAYKSSPLKWLFPMPHANFGAHFDGFRAAKHMALGASYLYFGALFIILLVIDFILVKKTNMEA